MIFGKRTRAFASVLVTVGLIVTVCTTGLMTGGCGGGGSQSGPGTPSTAANATVTGRVVDNSNNAPVAGATVSLGDQQVVTGADGTFSFSVAPNRTDAVIKVVGPQGYLDSGYVGGRITSLGTGFTLPVLTAEQQYSIGDISIVGPNSPPLPPIFPS